MASKVGPEVGPLLEEDAAVREARVAQGSTHGRLRKQLVCAVLGASGLAGIATLCPTGNRSLSEGKSLGTMELEEVADKSPALCTPEGGNCAETKCCLDGGEHGLQCYAKDDFYALCSSNATCVKGVHDGETHGTYDQYGTFQLDKWACDELGERSGKGCTSYKTEDDCPASSCEWFRTDTCLPKCDLFTSAGACPSTHCMWDGAACVRDPCSTKYDEDCSSTKCCSSARGSGGFQCYKKNKDWSSCLESCDGNGTQEGWACEELGERAKLPAPCSWAGKDCSQTHCCSNTGFSCVVKDSSYTGCVMTNKHTTWTDDFVPLPDGWEGTVLGKWSDEYEVGPAGDGEPMAGTSFFCFMAVLPDSPEVALMEVAKKKNQSIFACNASTVYDSWVSSSEGWDTGEATLVNTGVFFKIWDQVREDGQYSKYDWTIKVDADCAFVPDRLRSHLWSLRPPAGVAVYLKNTDQDAGLSNGQFLGAIEIFSKKAVQIYFDNAKDCHDSMGDNSGEDGFFKGCMDALGVGYMHDGDILKPDFAASYCKTESKVAFHPLKDPGVLDSCYNLIAGKPMDWAHNVA